MAAKYFERATQLDPRYALAGFGSFGHATGKPSQALFLVKRVFSVGGVMMSANRGPKRGMSSLILRGTMFNPIVVAIVWEQLLLALVWRCPRQFRRYNAPELVLTLCRRNDLCLNWFTEIHCRGRFSCAYS